MEVKQSIEKSLIPETKALMIRVPKEHAAMTYFTLEANEGLCFNSTMEDSLGKGHRDILIQIPSAFVEEVHQVLEGLKKYYPIQEIPVPNT
jgi:hypothetical protein